MKKQQQQLKRRKKKFKFNNLCRSKFFGSRLHFYMYMYNSHAMTKE